MSPNKIFAHLIKKWKFYSINWIKIATVIIFLESYKYVYQFMIYYWKKNFIPKSPMKYLILMKRYSSMKEPIKSSNTIINEWSWWRTWRIFKTTSTIFTSIMKNNFTILSIKKEKNLLVKFLLHFMITMLEKCFFKNMNPIKTFYIISWSNFFWKSNPFFVLKKYNYWIVTILVKYF